jgi:hypothetical protein
VKRVRIIRILSFLLLSTYFTTISFAQVSLDALIQRRDAIKSWALTCNKDGHERLLTFNHNPEGDNECDQGDSTIFAGINCLAARIAGDHTWADDRCRDVWVAQGTDGRMWRGLVHVDGGENPTAFRVNSFSRDQALGFLATVLSEGHFNPNPDLREAAKQKAKRWMEWINTEGKGGMCVDPNGKVPQLCRINGAFGSIFYKVMKKIGAIDSSNKNTRLVKKLKRLNFWFKKITVPEIQIQRRVKKIIPKGFTGDFEFHLKSIQLIMDRLILGKSNSYLDKLSKELYKWDSKNPVYQALYEGVKTKNFDEILNKYCPVNRYTPDQFPDQVSFFADSSFFIQNKMSTRKYYISMGHDCIYAINIIIAVNNGVLPQIKRIKKNKCKLGHYRIGNYEGLPVCKPLVSTQLSKAKCTYYNGFEWSRPKNQKNYCLIFRDGRYMAKRLKSSICPGGSKHEGERDGIPVCRVKRVNGFSQTTCSAYDEYLFDDPITKRFCFVPENGYWKKYKITRKCKAGLKFLGDVNPWGGWPLCRAQISKRLKVGNDYHTTAADLAGNRIENVKLPKACKKNIYVPGQGLHPLVHKNYCGVAERGYFKAYRYDTCPRTMKWLFQYDGASVCKAVASSKISRKKCQRKGRLEVNGYCLQKRKKGKYFKARRLK